MSRLTLVSTLAALALASAVHAQPVENAAPPKAAAPAVLSETEKAAIDLLSIISQRDQALKDLGTCTAQLAPLQAQAREGQLRQRVQALRQTIESAHPGYQWDIEKGTLVPKPPAVAKAAGTP